ncbi:KTSC domain-containing protein [Bacillus inaquosorum]|nr:KTSC domain-containing protein [Bacillus inaquosorum]
MNLVPVNSSNLSAVGYDSQSKVLRIVFKNGTYDHFDVPKGVYDSLMSAPSKGKYYHACIKNRYRYVRV